MITKLYYLANIRLPTEKAHGIQTMKMCEAFAAQGMTVELLVPRRLNPLKDDPFSFYGVEKNFTITKIPCLDLISIAPWLGTLAYWLEALSFAWFLKKRVGPGVIYTREFSNMTFLPQSRGLIYEAHNIPKRVSDLYRRVLAKAARLVVITTGLKEDFIKLGLSAEKILVARDAVDVAQFQIQATPEECREKLGLPKTQIMVVYTGHLYDWKGAGVLAEAVKLLASDIHVYLIGGTTADVFRFQQNYQAPNLHIIGWQKHELMPWWQAAANILVLPNSAKSTQSTRYTSPLKAFEYLAAGRAIVASDLPALREALNDADRVLFVTPDSASDLAQGIKRLLSDEVTGNEMERVKELRDFSWNNRAKKILEFIASF